MAHQVTDQHRLRGRDRIAVLLPDLDVLERRQVVGDRRVEVELALLNQRHRRDRNDRLGHRKDAEDGFVRHRRGLAGALDAEALLERDLALAADQQVGARNLAALHVGVQRRPDRVQLGGVEAQRRSLARHDRGGRRIDSCRDGLAGGGSREHQCCTCGNHATTGHQVEHVFPSLAVLSGRAISLGSTAIPALLERPAATTDITDQRR